MSARGTSARNVFENRPLIQMSTRIGALVSVSMLQPTRSATSPLRVAVASVPIGDAPSANTPSFRHSSIVVPVPPPTLGALMHTEWTPYGTATVPLKPWFGPDAGYAAPTSGRG